jgi:hypothetical protein
MESRGVVPNRRRTVTLKASVLDLYESRFGAPSRRAQFDVDDHHMDVCKWSADRTSEGVAIYATLGVSTVTPKESPTHRHEFFIGLHPEKDDVVRALAVLGIHEARSNEALDHGHTVTLDWPLWERAQVRTFLVARQRGEIIPTLTLPEGLHVEFLQAIPVFESELDFKRRYGVDALLRHWADRQVPFWDPMRVAEPS